MWTGAAPAARAAAQLANPPAGAAGGGGASVGGGAAQVVVGPSVVVVVDSMVVVLTPRVDAVSGDVDGEVTSERNGLAGPVVGIVDVGCAVRVPVRSSLTIPPTTVSTMSPTSAQVARRAERGQ